MAMSALLSVNAHDIIKCAEDVLKRSNSSKD